jgi:hypothetical protein
MALTELARIPSISKVIRMGDRYAELYPMYPGWQQQPATADGRLLFLEWTEAHNSLLQQARFLILRELASAAARDGVGRDISAPLAGALPAVSSLRKSSSGGGGSDFKQQGWQRLGTDLKGSETTVVILKNGQPPVANAPEQERLPSLPTHLAEDGSTGYLAEDGSTAGGWVHAQALQAVVLSNGISRATFLRARDALKREEVISVVRRGKKWMWGLNFST